MISIPTLADLNLQAALPAIMLLVGTLILLMVDLFLPEERKGWTPILALIGLGVSFVLTLLNFNVDNPLALGGMFIGDTFTNFITLLVLITAFISIIISIDYLRRTDINHGEYYILLLLSASGAMFMAASNDLVMVFISLELLSIPLYILATFRALDKKNPAAGERSEESGIKYFILGAFSSAFFVYGAALIYGATGTTYLPEIFASVEKIVSQESINAAFYLLAGTGLLFIGLGFKVAIVPFHMWTPDVYDGAPTPITAYMSVAAKLGGFAALFRAIAMATSGFAFAGATAAMWQDTVVILAALTMILGNVVAISQTNLKRMLAYSSIAHAGYVLIALAAAADPAVGQLAVQSALVYLLAYMFTNLGAFTVVLAIEKDDGTPVELNDLIGLSRSKPLLAAAMAVFMLSLIGVPLTAGFVGKLVVFSAALQAGLLGLLVIGVLTSVISAFYYVRVIVNMYLRDDHEGSAALGATSRVRSMIYVSVLGTLVLGILIPLTLGFVSDINIIF